MAKKRAKTLYVESDGPDSTAFTKAQCEEVGRCDMDEGETWEYDVYEYKGTVIMEKDVIISFRPKKKK